MLLIVSTYKDFSFFLLKKHRHLKKKKYFCKCFWYTPTVFLYVHIVCWLVCMGKLTIVSKQTGRMRNLWSKLTQQTQKLILKLLQSNKEERSQLHVRTQIPVKKEGTAIWSWLVAHLKLNLKGNLAGGNDKATLTWSWCLDKLYFLRWIFWRYKITDPN